MNAPAPDRRAIHGRPAVPLLGVWFDCLTETELVEVLVGRSKANQGGFVVTPNLDALRSMVRSAQVLELVRAADVCVADGMPLVWASHVQRTPLPERVAGSDLVTSLSERICRENRTLFLLGGNPGVADRAADELVGRFPALRIAGTYCPPLGFWSDEVEVARLLAAVDAGDPDFIYIGLPFVLAAQVGREIRARRPGTWCLGLGISLSFVTGEIRRAPLWVQRSGLEWLHRLVQEPERLARRYLIDGAPIALRLFFSAARQRRSNRPVTSDLP